MSRPGRRPAPGAPGGPGPGLRSARPRRPLRSRPASTSSVPRLDRVAPCLVGGSYNQRSGRTSATHAGRTTPGDPFVIPGWLGEPHLTDPRSPPCTTAPPWPAPPCSRPHSS
ncbi:protein of unknown function [Modestobacter italicus]|uniref:Uncharacterized protein n=1 Tax=Modestobacter italicus (strain DSM 44449 / CECT 9708 / BC 501) TaxID=2732864 RepID=I4F543_MODI5|nr:protein of unknown function [Modestobacter marinus]